MPQSTKHSDRRQTLTGHILGDQQGLVDQQIVQVIVDKLGYSSSEVNT